jgi:hypothetical protein
MAHVMTFRTTRFDLSKEPPNPINPIAGHGLLAWLRDVLAGAGYQVTEPDTEDWGWYMDVAGPGASYLVGASADAHDLGPTVEWTLQIHRARSVKDRLFGGNKIAPADPLSSLIECTLRSDPAIEVMAVDRDG